MKNIKMIRILYIVASLILAKISFDLIYNGYFSYLPTPPEHLNASTNISPELRLYRQTYIDAYQKSIYFSVFIFFVAIVIFEYFHSTIKKTGILIKTKQQPITELIDEKNIQKISKQTRRHGEISIDEVASLLVEKITDNIELSWDIDKQTLTALTSELGNDKYVKMEILFAMVTVELLAVKNAMPTHYESLRKKIINCIIQKNEYTDLVTKALTIEYPQAISEAGRRSELPIEGILYVISKRLNIKRSPISGTAILEMLTLKSGIWKYITNKYTLITS